jgi:hypothetical protein
MGSGHRYAETISGRACQREVFIFFLRFSCLSQRILSSASNVVSQQNLGEHNGRGRDEDFSSDAGWHRAGCSPVSYSDGT